MKDAIRHLDRRFAKLRGVDLRRPPKGWLRAIRDALGMTTTQFAERLGVSQPRVTELEQYEESGGVTLKTLQQAAEVLGCRLVYALIPEKPLEETVRTRANAVADRQMKAVEQTMRLEDQAVKGKRAREELRKEIIEELMQRPSRLWQDK